MASNSVPILALFIASITVLQPILTSSDPNFLSPLLSPIIGNICNRVGCGRGKCKMSQNGDLQYECECDPGWRQTLSLNSTHLKFLPCVIPNCTLNYSCAEAAPSPRPQRTPSPASSLDPCEWANCGGGECNKTSAFTYTCHCNEGYNNLFNNTSFPCLNECSIGGDCPNLGIALSNRTTNAPPPSLADRGGKSGNQASSKKHGIWSHWMILLSISIAAFGL